MSRLIIKSSRNERQRLRKQVNLSDGTSAREVHFLQIFAANVHQLPNFPFTKEMVLFTLNRSVFQLCVHAIIPYNAIHIEYRFEYNTGMCSQDFCSILLSQIAELLVLHLHLLKLYTNKVCVQQTILLLNIDHLNMFLLFLYLKSYISTKQQTKESSSFHYNVLKTLKISFFVTLKLYFNKTIHKSKF